MSYSTEPRGKSAYDLCMEQPQEPSSEQSPFLDEMVDDPEADEFGYPVSLPEPLIYGDDDEA